MHYVISHQSDGPLKWVAGDGTIQIAIVDGPGAGQVRKIVGRDDHTFYIDRPWDYMPTTESFYMIDGNMGARNLIVNNDFLAKANKGSIAFYGNDYDTVVAGNNLAGGAGIWTAVNSGGEAACTNPAGGVPYAAWNNFSMFMTVYNNILTGVGDPDFLMSMTVAIGPGSDGGINTGNTNVGNYGMRVINNELRGPGTDPSVGYNGIIQSSICQ